MTRTLMCFGDSNTHGTPPIVEGVDPVRHGPQTRWPCIAHRALGAGWDLVEEGLPGRTAQFKDPVMGAHMDGRIGLDIALNSHGPIDVMTLMLGTNDVKTRFAVSADHVLAGIAGLLDVALGEVAQTRHGGFKILLICPTPVLEQGPFAGEFYGGRAKSLALPPLYQALAAARGIGFLDAGQIIEASPIDGVHFGAEAHATLGAAAAEAIAAL